MADEPTPPAEPTYYDVKDNKTWPITEPFASAYRAWLAAHGIDPKDTVRTEHHTLDAPFVRVIQIARDAAGRRLLDDEGHIQLLPPYDVLVSTPPPNPKDYM